MSSRLDSAKIETVSSVAAVKHAGINPNPSVPIFCFTGKRIIQARRTEFKKMNMIEPSAARDNRPISRGDRKGDTALK